MTIDDTLLRDCHVLGRIDHAAVLLNRNAAVGWLILVPETAAVDWHALDDAEHARISGQIRALSAAVMAHFRADKLNVATLGNEVRQMHIHVIARHHDDPCWPKPVWGHLTTHRDYAGTEISALRAKLADRLGLIEGGQT